MANSVRPEPIRPLIPTTSPLRKLICMFLHIFRPAYSGCSTVQFFTSKYTSPTGVCREGKRSDSFLPTIAAIKTSSAQSSFFLSNVFITQPSLKTVILSATNETSFNLCEIIIEVIPCFLNSSSNCNNLRESDSLSEAVGSSRISNVRFLDKALAISTNCCFPMPMSFTAVRDDSLSPTFCKSVSARA